MVRRRIDASFKGCLCRLIMVLHVDKRANLFIFLSWSEKVCDVGEGRSLDGEEGNRCKLERLSLLFYHGDVCKQETISIYFSFVE